MSRQQRSMLTLALVTALVGTALILPGLIGAEDAFFPIAVSKKNFAPAEKTGQTTSYATGDDGDLQKGVAWPDPRFTDNGDGTVTDNSTELIWLKDANCITTHYPGFDNDGAAADGKVTWQHALDFVAGINAGIYLQCGAGFTDWRLANTNELHSLVHYGFSDPALPNKMGTGQWAEGSAFSNVQSDYYWASTTGAPPFTNQAWIIDFNYGFAQFAFKGFDYHVWCVRGGP